MSLCAVAQPAATPPTSAGSNCASRCIQRSASSRCARNCATWAVAAEQRVVVDERGLDLVVARQRRALGQHQLPRGLALGERPVGDAVLGDEPRRGLRDAGAVLRVPSEGIGP